MVSIGCQSPQASLTLQVVRALLSEEGREAGKEARKMLKILREVRPLTGRYSAVKPLQS